MAERPRFRLWHRIDFKISALLCASLLFVLSLSVAVDMLKLGDRASIQLVRQSEDLLKGIQQLAVEGRPHDLSRIETVMRAHASADEFGHTLLLSSTGRVLASSDSTLEGTQMTQSEHVCATCHGSKKRLAQSIQPLDDGRVLRLVLPLRHNAHCASCHGSGASALGHLVIDRRHSQLRATALADLKRDAGLIGSVLILMVITVSISIHWLVIGRLKCLQDRARRIAEGEPVTESCVKGMDEIASLARSFHNMTNHLQKSARHLAAQHEYLGRLLESLEDGLLILDEHRQVVYLNSRFVRILDDPGRIITPGAVLEPSASPLDLLGRVVALSLSAFRAHRGLGEVIRLAGDGDVQRHLEVHISLLDCSRDSACEAVISVRDISNRVDLQEQLYRAEKLATIGQLAAGVAHEINNPMACIMACAEGLKTEGPQVTGRRGEYLEIISASARRCRQITQKLLNYSARTEIDAGPVDLKDVLQEARAVTQFEAERRHVRIISIENGPLPPVIGSEDLLIQVFVDLLLNGMQATAAGGQVKIEVAANGGNVTVYIADNGPGVRPDIRSRIFDPFFTTKGVGEGTGLGLSVSQGIVRQLGGTLELVSRYPGWTCFCLSLPAAPRLEALHA